MTSQAVEGTWIGTGGSGANRVNTDFCHSIKVLREFAIFSYFQGNTLFCVPKVGHLHTFSRPVVEFFYESAGPIVVVGKKGGMPGAMDTLGIDRAINTADFEANFCSIIGPSVYNIYISVPRL